MISPPILLGVIILNKVGGLMVVVILNKIEVGPLLN